MNLLAKTAIVTSIVTGFFASSATQAASLDVDVDVTVPDVLILYAYTDIDLSFSAGEFAALLDSSAICTTDGSGNEDCSSDFGTQSGSITGGTVDLGIESDIATAGTSETITLQNSWAVRALGHGTFNASVADNGSEASVSNISITPASGTPSMVATPGDVSFDIDLTDPDPSGDNAVNANYTITVTGS